MILRLGHVEMSVDDLGAARAFYVDLLGFVVSDEAPGTLYLRAAGDFDRWTLKVTEGGGGGLLHAGFRVDSPDELDRLEELHRELGLPTARVAEGVEPGEGPTLRVLTPEGVPVDFFHEFEEIALHDESGRVVLPMRGGGQRAGVRTARIDHINLHVPSVESALAYWRGELDFSVSEYIVGEDGSTFLAWLRRRAGSHDVALGTGHATELHHFCFYVDAYEDVVSAADVLADAGLLAQLDVPPTRHGVSNALTMYCRDPAGNRLEIMTSDYIRDLDRPSIAWTWDDFRQRGSFAWGVQPPERFRQCAPVLGAGWPERAPLANVSVRA